MCPATGSSGSTSPRKRSRARASTRSSERVVRLAATADASRFDARGRAMNVVRVSIGVAVATGRPSRVHAANPPSSTAAASCPSARSIHHRRAAYMPLPWSYATTCLVASMPRRPHSSAQALASGSGCRPLRPVFGADRSRSRWTNRAPGRWPSRYADSPHASGCVRSWRTSTRTNAGSARCAARSAVEMSVVNISRSSPWSGTQRGAMCASSSRRRNSWKCCIPSSIGDW